MKKKNLVKAKAKRPNVADGIDNSAKRISATLNKAPTATSGWDQNRIAGLKDFDGKVGSVPIQLIRTNENIRNRIDEDSDDFRELVESIKTHGVLQAPIVTVLTDERGIHSILLVGGERRLKAWKNLGHESINCLVKLFEAKTTRMTASMAENMNRKDLNPLEIAYCFESLTKQTYKYADIQKLFGRDEKTIGRYIKMARWPQRIRTKVADHSEKFNSRFLLDLASRSLNNDELEKAIDLRIGIEKPNKKLKQRASARVTAYFESKKIPQRDREIIMQALTDLGFLKIAPKAKKTLRSLNGATAHP